MAIRAMAGRRFGGGWRFVATGMVVFAILAGMSGSAYPTSETCLPSDRFSGIRGCGTRIVIPDFSPLVSQAIIRPQGANTISLFGWSIAADGAVKSEIVRLDLPGGEVRGRIALPAKDVQFIRESADGAQAMLYCYAGCNDNGDHVLVVSVSDGRMLAAFTDATAIARPFPGETELQKNPVEKAARVRGGKYVATLSEDEKEIVVHAIDDGRVVGKLQHGVLDRATMLLQSSPSGRLIAALDAEPKWKNQGDRSVIRIWDIENGRLLASIDTDLRYTRDLLWSQDEKTISVVHHTQSGGKAATVIDVYECEACASRAPGSL